MPSSANPLQHDAPRQGPVPGPRFVHLWHANGNLQEVAGWFLAVGATPGTVAETISACDKTVSDDIDGAGTRYVSKEPLWTCWTMSTRFCSTG